MTAAELERIVEDYASGILSGAIPSCKFVRLAVERYRHDQTRSDLYFGWDPVLLFVCFAECLKHFKGDLAGLAIDLQPWQIFIAANILGWKYVATGRRRYKYADILVPRKNGKTTFAAILALFLLFLDGEAGAEVYTAAVDKAQAKICFEAAKILIRDSAYGKVMTLHRGEIRYEKTNSFLMPLSKDTKNKDGLNPHAAVCDERHAWTTNEMVDVIKTGMGSRSQPLLISISTAGVDTSLPYYSDVQLYCDVMLGIKEMDNHFIMLYLPDEGDRWDDPETWRKVNPNLGVSLLESYMVAECEEAKLKGGTTLVSFQVKNLNMWVDAPDVWIPDDDVILNNAAFDVSLLANEECYVGMDLASKNDISAVALFFPKFNVARFLFVVPEEKVRETEDRVDYRLWASEGWLTVTPGKVLDEEWFVTYLLLQLAPYDVKCLAYDPWAVWNLVPKLERYKEQLMAYQQSIRYMSVPSKWIQTEVLQHHLNFLDNPVIRWMFRNVVIYVDPNANIKLNKAKSRNKIDGVVALADAVGGWLNITGGETKEIYKGSTLRVISMDDDDEE